MGTFAARPALDPVLDVQSLDHLTEPDPASGARARLRGLPAVLARVGLAVTGREIGVAWLDGHPDTPPVAASRPHRGEPADRLREAARDQPDTRPLDWAGRQETVRDEPEGSRAAASSPGSPRQAP